MTRKGGGGRRSPKWRLDWEVAEDGGVALVPTQQCFSNGPPHHPMQHKKVRKQPLNLGRLKTTVLDVHGSHLPRHHDPSRVKILGNVQLLRQPKNLRKLS
jgi:hypothetical protein